MRCGWGCSACFLNRFDHTWVKSIECETWVKIGKPYFAKYFAKYNNPLKATIITWHNDRYLKNVASKSIVHVIKHASFQLYIEHPDEVI